MQDFVARMVLTCWHALTLQVTLTSSRQGKFESKFFHKVYAEEFGTVRGHFGPVNAVAYHPDGRAFVTGGEDGYIRLHHFDNDYLTNRFF